MHRDNIKYYKKFKTQNCNFLGWRHLLGRPKSVLIMIWMAIGAGSATSAMQNEVDLYRQDSSASSQFQRLSTQLSEDFVKSNDPKAVLEHLVDLSPWYRYVIFQNKARVFSTNPALDFMRETFLKGSLEDPYKRKLFRRKIIDEVGDLPYEKYPNVEFKSIDYFEKFLNNVRNSILFQKEIKGYAFSPDSFETDNAIKRIDDAIEMDSSSPGILACNSETNGDVAGYKNALELGKDCICVMLKIREDLEKIHDQSEEKQEIESIASNSILGDGGLTIDDATREAWSRLFVKCREKYKSDIVRDMVIVLTDQWLGSYELPSNDFCSEIQIVNKNFLKAIDAWKAVFDQGKPVNNLTCEDVEAAFPITMDAMWSVSNFLRRYDETYDLTDNSLFKMWGDILYPVVLIYDLPGWGRSLEDLKNFIKKDTRKRKAEGLGVLNCISKKLHVVEKSSLIKSNDINELYNNINLFFKNLKESCDFEPKKVKKSIKEVKDAFSLLNETLLAQKEELKFFETDQNFESNMRFVGEKVDVALQDLQKTLLQIIEPFSHEKKMLVLQDSEQRKVPSSLKIKGRMQEQTNSIRNSMDGRRRNLSIARSSLNGPLSISIYNSKNSNSAKRSHENEEKNRESIRDSIRDSFMHSSIQLNEQSDVSPAIQNFLTVNSEKDSRYYSMQNSDYNHVRRSLRAPLVYESAAKEKRLSRLDRSMNRSIDQNGKEDLIVPAKKYIIVKGRNYSYIKNKINKTFKDLKDVDLKYFTQYDERGFNEKLKEKARDIKFLHSGFLHFWEMMKDAEFGLEFLDTMRELEKLRGFNVWSSNNSDLN